MKSKIVSIGTQKIVFLSLDAGNKFIRYRVEKPKCF